MTLPPDQYPFRLNDRVRFRHLQGGKTGVVVNERAKHLHRGIVSPAAHWVIVLLDDPYPCGTRALIAACEDLSRENPHDLRCGFFYLLSLDDGSSVEAALHGIGDDGLIFRGDLWRCKGISSSQIIVEYDCFSVSMKWNFDRIDGPIIPKVEPAVRYQGRAYLAK